MKIVVYTIALDEAQFVDRWMDSMGEADAVVVLDTGSRDGTVERLRGRGAKVETTRYARWGSVSEYRRVLAASEKDAAAPRPWRFDWARNDSIDLAMRLVPDADLLVCTDLDEFFLPGWRARLEAAWSAALGRGERPTTASYEYVWNFNPDGSDGIKFWYEKVHAPAANARWTHPVHEILAYPDGKRTVGVPEMRLEHHADPRKSRSQYLHMLELSVAECPDDDRNMHYLGREYMFRRRWDDAIAALTRHLAMPGARWKAERAASMRYIARCWGEKGDKARQEAFLWRACNEEPTQREAALELAELANAERDWPLLVAACERCLAVKERRMTYLTKAEAWGARPHDLLSVGLWYVGRREEALKANAEAMRLAPDDARLRANDETMRRMMAEDEARRTAESPS
jgi:tetratricopeptide (TPR) repeat protein